MRDEEKEQQGLLNACYKRVCEYVLRRFCNLLAEGRKKILKITPHSRKKEGFKFHTRDIRHRNSTLRRGREGGFDEEQQQQQWRLEAARKILKNITGRALLCVVWKKGDTLSRVIFSRS